MKKIPELAMKNARRFLEWVSPSTRLFAFLLGLVFVFSLGSWAIFDRNTSYILYFPTLSGTALQGETRYMTRRSAVEARAQELVSEFLLGPANPGLLPALPSGTSLNGVLYRKGTLYIDLDEQAALLPESDLRLALGALDRTVRVGMHQVRHVVLTIGGIQPWAEAIVPSSTATARKTVK